MNDFVSELRARRKVKYGTLDIKEFASMFKEGAEDKLPQDLAPYLVSHRPENDDELSLWIHVCLEQQGLVCKFTREPNLLQTDLKDTCSHLQYLSDTFFERTGDCIVLGNRGAGKCLGRGTPVMMWDGTIKPVEEVVDGDLLMGDDSTPRTVLSTTHGYGPLYEVIPVKGSPYIVNDAHILSLKYGKSTYYGKRHKERVHDISIQEYLKLNKTHRRELKGYRVPVDTFGAEQKVLPVPPYLLGLWLGDGHRHSFSITTPDQEIIDYLYQVASTNNMDIRITKHPIKNVECSTYHFKGKINRPGNKPMWDYIRSQGLTEVRHIPHEYKTASRQDRLELLAGLIDTDGTLDHNGATLNYCSKSEQLANDVAYLARSLGLAAYPIPVRKTCTNAPNGPVTGTYYIMCISGNTSIIPIRLAKKKPHERRQIKDVLLTGITVKPIGDGDYYGFVIDGNHRFLLGDFTVTHNTLTFATSLLIESIFKDGYEMAHLGSIEDQARRCYRYFRKMTDHPLFNKFLARQPTATRTDFVNGSSVEILVGTMAGVNCIHGDMLIECSRDMTKYPDGVPIRELVDKEFVVPSLNEETGEVTYRKAKGLYSGKSPCLRIDLAKPKQGTQGKELEYTHLICTPDHPILMADSHKYRLAKNLTKGDRVQSGLGGGYIHRPNPKYGTRQRPECRANIQPAWKQKGKIASQHRLIAAAWFGEDAIKDKVIHHKDGNRLNNSVDNLEIMDGIQHHFHHFGDDSQAYITREAINKMADKRSIKGKLTYYWQDKDWLYNELQSKSVAQIAEEQDVHYETIRKWVSIFNLPYTSSSFGYNSATAAEHMEDIRKQCRVETVTTQEIVDTPKKQPISAQIHLTDKNRPMPFKDPAWLKEELISKAATQIAFEWNVPTATVVKYAQDFGLEYKYSSPEYTEAKVRKHIKELRSKQQAEYERQFALLSPEQQAIELAYRATLDNRKACRADQLKPKAGAWTVLSVELYQDGEEQDVFDISVYSDGDTGHNFNTQKFVIRNSPHPVCSQLDEVELMDWSILQEAFNMARSAKGYSSSTRLTSTRKKATGTMQRLLDEAQSRGLKVYQWNLWDTIETCPLRTDADGNPNDNHTVYSYTDKRGEVKSCFVYESCMECSLLKPCRGQAKSSNAGAGAVVAFQDAVKLYKTLDPSVWDSQVICIKPGYSNLVYPMFDPNIHVIDYKAMLKEKYGDDYNEMFDSDLETYAGQDAGFGCPATVFLQVMENAETGEQTVIIFDEIYEKNVAPSKYVSDFLIPKQDLYNVQEWFCDPSNSQQLMAEMELQDLYTIPGLKNVDEGVDAVRALFSLGRLLIDKHCTNLLWELNRYEKQPNGKPRKINDHLVDAMRFGINGVGLYNQVLEEVYK